MRSLSLPLSVPLRLSFSPSLPQVFRLGEEVPTRDASVDDLQAAIECQVDGNALKTAPSHDVFVHGIGWSRLTRVTHLTDQIITAVGAYMDGFATALAANIDP
jgi:hypothetical protein